MFSMLFLTVSALAMTEIAGCSRACTSQRRREASLLPSEVPLSLLFLFDFLFLSMLGCFCLIFKYRDNRSSRSSLLDGFDSMEEGGLRASSSYSHELNEGDNDRAIESLHDRVSFLKQLTGDIHEEVESHNQLLDRVGNKMDGSRGMMLGTMDRFKKVFEKKSTRKTCSLVAYFTFAFIFIYYLIRMLGYFALGLNYDIACMKLRECLLHTSAVELVLYRSTLS
ncbi:hypothetical protein RJT34_24253 [Clitoria ternatea]|uniref:t-SNARE coiled-coil homology domain-containing protein n=1 Tax=Clitoria ternatea TaxID=43366 RepID=A0AAN9FMK8_CLITE